jgi:hypothetical protein
MIQILWATARPKMFIQRHKNWMKNASKKHFIHTLVAVNTIDEKDEILLNYDEISQRLQDYQVKVKVTGDENLGVVYPIYELSKDLKLNDKDIVIVVCDDVECPENWDEYLVDEFKLWNGALMIRDGYQHYEYDISKMISKKIIPPAVSMPVMTFKCLKKLNMIIFHPDYKHYFADNELFLNLYELGLLKDDRNSDSVIFEHIHYCTGKRASDKLDDKIIGLGNQDRGMYFKRINLAVQDRIKLNSFGENK